MPQDPNPQTWRSIRFEGTDLQPSLMAISILISVDDFSERTGDWIWSLPHCSGVKKEGDAPWCADSATEIIDYLLEHRAEVLPFIAERLQEHGFDPETTYAEWMASLAKIREIACRMDGDCQWIAEIPGDDPKPDIKRWMRFFDSNEPIP